MKHPFLAATALLVASMASSFATTFPFVNGDLILGFQATGGTGSSQNVFVDLGPAVNLRDNGAAGQLANIGNTLSTVFGSNWYTRTDLYFGVVGNLNFGPDSGFGAQSPVAGDPSRTFYVSLPADTPGSASLIPAATYSSSALGIAGNSFSGLETMLVGTPSISGLVARADGSAILDQTSQPIQWSNGWTNWNPSVGAAFTVFADGIQQSFGNSGTTTYVDIQRVLATSTGAKPTGVVGGGTYISTIGVSSSGAITASVPAAQKVPKIVVQQPVGSNLKDGTASRSFGTVVVGQSGTAKSFTIKNSGNANLNSIAITSTGTAKADFIVSTPAKTVLTPGSSTTFKVTFKPKAKGTRTAAIHIKSNDATQSPFDIKLTGMGN